MNSQKKTAGYLMILAAITFWISWFLMPDPGTTDAAHILTIVRQSRMPVLCSVITQIISSILFISALLLLAIRVQAEKKITVIGFVLFGIGVLGLCADAFFHFLAWCMTDESVAIQNNVVRVMEMMQKEGVVLLAPILLPIFIGGLMLTIGFWKQKVISKYAAILVIAAILAAIIIPVSVRLLFGHSSAVISHIILGLFAAGLVVTGWELASPKGKKYRMNELLEVYW